MTRGLTVVHERRQRFCWSERLNEAAGCRTRSRLEFVQRQTLDRTVAFPSPCRARWSRPVSVGGIGCRGVCKRRWQCGRVPKFTTASGWRQRTCGETTTLPSGVELAEWQSDSWRGVRPCALRRAPPHPSRDRPHLEDVPVTATFASSAAVRYWPAWMRARTFSIVRRMGKPRSDRAPSYHRGNGASLRSRYRGVRARRVKYRVESDELPDANENGVWIVYFCG
jgi:hypothetical protein